MKDSLRAPFPYFGGKSKVAPQVWAALGDVKHYIEPFFGSGAVLLARPNYDFRKHIETINDKDGFIANVWRSIQFSPDETAYWCDWPVNHADLAARKGALIKNEERLLENLIADDMWHDPIMAGYWIWAASCWIGHGLTKITQRPRVSGFGGTGVHRIGKRPFLQHGGKGVNRIGQRPHLSNGGCAITNPKSEPIYDWMNALSERLRYVRVVCGDWTRVCGGYWQNDCGIVGIFLDPPYGKKATRDKRIYHRDTTDVADNVSAWALERGSLPSYRIVLAGYYEEHEHLLAHGWRVFRWKSTGGYSNLGDKQGKINRSRECLFLSPGCCSDGLFQEYDKRVEYAQSDRM